MVIIQMMGGDVYVVNDMVVRLPVVSNNHQQCRDGRRGEAAEAYIVIYKMVIVIMMRV